MELYPDAKPTIGPAIDRGFYYDFAMEPIGEGDLKPIEKKMHEIARRNLKVERVELMIKNFVTTSHPTHTRLKSSISWKMVMINDLQAR